MNNLESIIPPLELCKLIPEREFDDCVFCWELEKPAFVCGINGAIEPRPTWNARQRPPRSRQLHRANGEEIYNAPTLAEIMAELPHGTYCEWQGTTPHFVMRCPLYDTCPVHNNAATAALRLWLKLKGIEAQAEVLK